MNVFRKNLYANIIACPDCRGRLGEVKINHHFLGLFCEKCQVVFPVIEDIPILLGKRVRNYALEHGLIDNIKQEAMDYSIEWLGEYIKNTQNLLNPHKNKTAWAWEDEEYWNRVYTKEATVETPKNWNDRIWQREFLMEHLADQMSLKGKTILDVGCGEGQNFRLLMVGYCDETTLYVATDVSLAGLKLNRLRNEHKNSIYILCSADSLPIQKETIDVLCYFGILHHTERKAATIAEDSGLVRSGGCILIHEVLSRPSPSLLPGFLKPKAEESAHEESIDIHKLTTVISKSHLEILAVKPLGTIFFTGMMTLFTNIMVNNKIFFSLISRLDSALMKILGGIIPYFRAGGIMLVLRRRKPS